MVVGGEAGIGKTALVASVCEEVGSRRVLWGACDPLVTPRTLGPLRDVARDAGGALSDALEADGSREALLPPSSTSWPRSRSMLVIEDVHWADDATLDLVALLGRRLARARGCLVMTCRERGARPSGRRSAGPRGDPARGPASDRAGAALRDGRRRRWPPRRAIARDLHEGRAATRSSSPRCWPRRPARSRRCATPWPCASARSGRRRARSPRSPPSSRAPTGLCLLADTVAASPAAIDACVARGILLVRDDAVVFRHDLARRAVESEIGPAAAPRARGRRAARAGGDRRRRSGPARPPRPAGRRHRGDPPARARRRALGERRGQPPPGARALGGGAARRTRAPSRSRASRSRATCAASSRARSRRGARCCGSTRPGRSPTASGRTCAGCRGSCGGRVTGRRRPRPPTRRSRCSSRSRRAASSRWRSAAGPSS